MMTEAHAIKVDFLPQGLQDLIGVIGLEPALAFVKIYGGVRFSVPKKVSDELELVKIIGFEAAEKMIDVYKGELVSFPKFDAVPRQIKHEQIKQMLAQGISIRKIALETHYTERWINYLKADLLNDKQNTLF